MDSHSSNGESLWSKLRLKFFSKKYQIKNQRELLKIIHLAHERNVLDNESLAIIEGAIQVVDLQVRDIMIPRTSMVSIKLNACISEFLPQIIESAHSRFPVIDDKNDEVVGILLAKDLLPLILNEPNWRKHFINDILRPTVFVPESKRLNVLLRDFRSNHNHMAIVVDEYGGVAGIITIEDVLEQIVGDIADEHDIEQESYIKVLPCGDLVVKAITPISFLLKELKELKIEQITNQNDGQHMITVDNWIMQLFGHLPCRGEIAYCGGDFKIRILSADSMRIHLIRISKTSEYRTKNLSEI